MSYMVYRCLITCTILLHYGTVLTVSAAVNQTQQWTLYKQFVGWAMREPSYLTEIVTSKTKCVFNCFMMPECLLVDYETISNSCSYFTTATCHKFLYEPDHTVIVVGNTTGMALSAGHRQYAYTYQQARKACSSLSGRLMAKHELRSLYNNGYEYCSCGWIEGGSKFYPMQTARSGCGYGTGLIECSGFQFAHVWCMLE